MKHLIPILITGTLLVGCFNRDKKNNDNSTVEIVQPITKVDTVYITEETPLPTKRPEYHPAETQLTDLIHTKLEVKFDWEKSYMNGIATITAKPHFYSSDSLILDAKGMEILSVKMNGNPLTYAYADDVLKITLDKTYSRKESYKVVIQYIAKPDERTTGGSAAIMSDKGLYFINPKGEKNNQMPQIWTQGETEASSVWFPTIDAPNAKTSQEIFMTVDKKYATLSNGKLISSKVNRDGTRTDHWKQDLPHAPYLFMMGVGEFKVVKDTYTRPDGTKMEVNYYVEPEWEEYAKDIFGETPAMIKHFSELLGVEYPWDKYHQIVVREYVSGAMENTGAVIFGDYVYKNDRELLDGDDQSTIAHELFHHWFGDLVTCESWSNLPLNESFANYSQFLWDEHRYGIDQAEYYAEEEASGYYQSAQMQGYHDLIWFDYQDKEQMFDGHSYNKGGRILHMLRAYLGDEAFFEAIKNYLNENKFQPAEFHQLRIAFEKVSGEDLNWFFNQWFLGSGHPVLDYHMEVENGVATLTIDQTQDLKLSPIFKLPTEIALVDENGMTTYPIVIDELHEEFTFNISGDLKTWIPDNQQVMLAIIRENKLAKQYTQQYYAKDAKFRTRERALEYGTKRIDDASQQMVLDALEDPFWGIRTLAVEKAGKLKGEYKLKALETIQKLAINDEYSNVRKAALSFLSSAGECEIFASLYEERINNDLSYSVVASALNQLAKCDADKAMKKAKGLEKEKSSKMMGGIASLYAAHGDSTHFSFFDEILNGSILQGFDQIGAVNDFSLYLRGQSIDQWEKAIDIYEHLKVNGDFYTRMFLPQIANFMDQEVQQRIKSMDEVIAKHEEEGNPLYADQARREQKRWKELQPRYTALTNKN